MRSRFISLLFAADNVATMRSGFGLSALPFAAQIYIGVIVITSTVALVALMPEIYGRPILFLSLLLAACATSAWKIFASRLADLRRYTESTQLHKEAMRALTDARRAEQALGGEKERLAAALAEMTRLEEIRKHLLEREQGLRASAEEANRLKDEFLAVVSHELRTPLNAVLGWAQMLRHDNLDESKKQRALTAIFQNAARQAELIDELLDVSRITSGKLRLERGWVDWSRIVNAALDVIQPAAQAKRIAVSIEVERGVGPYFGDGARLQQIVWNLMTNGVKFTPEGGALRVAVTQSPEMVEVIVADTGPGIPREFLPSVFEPFRQADGSTTREHGGLGLGLAIVRHLVEAHGGTITAESREGQGATFTVRLPIRVSDGLGEPPSELPAPKPSQSWRSMEGISVLIVDDDVASREVIAAYLSDRKATVFCASSAAEALALLRRERVDVLLADIAMPGQDGYELLRQVRALPPPHRSRIPAAALTAFARQTDRQRTAEAGFQAHLVKPIDFTVLGETVVTLRHLRM